MKKKIIAVLICAVMLLSILPMASFADDTPDVIMVGSVDVTAGGYYKNDDSGDITSVGADESNYNVWYDTSKHVLNLQDAKISADSKHGYKQIIYIKALNKTTIKLCGNNVLSNDTSDEGIYCENDITIEGGDRKTDKLKIELNKEKALICFQSSKNLEIKNCNVYAHCNSNDPTDDTSSVVVGGKNVDVFDSDIDFKSGNVKTMSCISYNTPIHLTNSNAKLVADSNGTSTRISYDEIKLVDCTAEMSSNTDGSDATTFTSGNTGTGKYFKATQKTYNDPYNDDGGNTDVTRAPTDRNIAVWGKIWAADIDTPDGDDVAINVNIAWGSLKYDYKQSNWNATTLEYDTKGWTPVESGVSDKVTVTNRSNVPIDAGLAFVNIGGKYVNLKGTSDTDVFFKEKEYENKTTDNTFKLASAVGATEDSLPKDSTYLKVIGEPTDLSATDDYERIGTITVTIAQHVS